MEATAVRVERRGEVERCPYCHDLAGDPGSLVECPGCGTSHHVECLAELGRCTVLGCARPLHAPEARAPRPGLERVREQIRARVRGYVDRNVARLEVRPASPPGKGREPSPGDLESLRRAREELDRVTRWAPPAAQVGALETLIEVQTHLGDGADLRELAGWLPRAQRHARLAVGQEELARRRRVQPLVLGALGLLIVMILAMAGVLTRLLGTPAPPLPAPGAPRAARGAPSGWRSGRRRSWPSRSPWAPSSAPRSRPAWP